MRTISNKTDFMYMADTPVVYHCHHFNLFLDQTIDDALGIDEGTNLKIKVASSAAHQLITNLVQATGAATVMERLDLASAYFAGMGHGKLAITGNKNEGFAEGQYLHYGFTWSQKYGHRINRLNSADAFAAGFAAAALEVAHDLAPGTLTATEENCIALKDKKCHIIINESSENTPYKFVSKQQAEDSANEPITGIDEDKISEITKGLTEFTAGVGGDEDRGLVEAFGVFVTMHLSGYYNGISYEALKKCKDNPAMLNALGELLKESGHVCVFNTFGGMLLSPEWEGLVGKPTANGKDLIVYLTAIGRALGFGKWCIKEFVENEKFVLETSSTYENTYCHKYCTEMTRASDFFVQGAALAFMVLIHNLDWDSDIELTPELYDSLFKGSGLGWKVEQTKALSLGDNVTEVVVTKIVD